MSNKPRIKAFCDAGCGWETIHRSEFEQGATFIQKVIIDNRCYLELGKQYKIKSENTATGFGCSIVFIFNDNNVETAYNFDIPNDDKYSNYVVFRLLETTLSSDGKSITIVYEIAGVRYTDIISGTALALKTESYLYVENAEAVFQYNDDGNYAIVPYTVFIRYATSLTGENMSDTYSGQGYIGTYVGTEASSEPTDYTWVRFATTNIDIDGALSKTSTNPVQNKVITEALEALLEKVYPINSIYMSVDSTSPAELFGGEWEQLKDRFLLGTGDTYSNGATGGSADAVVVAHKHSFKMSNDGVGSNGYIQMTKGSAEYVQSSPIANTVDLNDQDITEDGVGKNMPPYLTVYMWKRVA